MKVLLTAEINGQYIKELEPLLEIQYEGWNRNQTILNEQEMARLVEGKDILVTSYDPVTKKVIDASGQLRLIACTRANPVNVDTAYAKSKGIKVIYSPARNTICTAEFTVALMLSVTRMIPFAYHALKNGEHLVGKPQQPKVAEGLRPDITWALGKGTPYVLYKGFQMSGHTLGVIGYGSIGREVARLCRAFQMKVLAYDPFIDPSAFEEGTRQVGLEELLRNSDIVTVHCKDTSETRGIMNAAAFACMKPSAYFINTSRGALVEEGALVEALREKRIAGAAVDVFSSEPLPRDHPFVAELDNIVITPHLAGATYDAIDHHTIQLVCDLKHFLKGEPLEYEYI